MAGIGETVHLSSLSPVLVTIETGCKANEEFRFPRSFRIGRSEECELQLDDEGVSRLHVDIRLENGQWSIYDLDSSNGTYLNGQSIQHAILPQQAAVELGRGGVRLVVSLVEKKGALTESAPFTSRQNHHQITDPESRSPISAPQQPEATNSPSPAKSTSQQQVPFEKSKNSSVLWAGDLSSPKEDGHVHSPSKGASLFSMDPAKERFGWWPFRRPMRSSVAATAGGLTESLQSILQSGSSSHSETIDQVRQEAHKFHRVRSRKFLVAIGVVTSIAIVFGGYALYLHMTRFQAADAIFYSMKALEVELAEAERTLIGKVSDADFQLIVNKRKAIKAKRHDYQQYIEDLGIVDSTMSAEDRLIYKMALLFGETITQVPKSFVTEVKVYINKWKTTPRLKQAIRLAVKHDYPRIVHQAMYRNDMPPQFFYLGLQESDFVVKVVGPKTRFGIAKGPWQFIPTTARQYGLKTGPLVGYEKFDPRDDRHDFQKATEAAARYIKYLYGTEAQASGLLVMASYNWGEGRVRKRINDMALNPEKRNFWNLLKEFKIPKQTYDYVFYIFSAAVIGENPRLFGFDFDNPLASFREGQG